jgi:single-strand DNA-binding protein
MLGLNKVMLIGSLGRDPEIRCCSGGTAMACFSLGVERAWVGADGERREAVDWFNVVTWRRLAEVCAQHLGKGSRVYVEGRLETRNWEDPQGQRHYRTEVVASDLIVLDGRGGRGAPEDAGEPACVDNGAGVSAPANDREA